MKRQFTSLRKQKIGFESTLTCREGVSTPTTPIKSVPLTQISFFWKLVQNGFKIWHLQINYLKNLCSFLLFFISICGIVNENFWIRSIKHIDNCRQCLILLIVPQDFLYEDNCNSSKNSSLVIHVHFPKHCFRKFWKNI